MEGSVWKTEQYIKVQFLWLLPLIVQCASTALLLILTIARSRSKTVPLWKSSALVLLHCMDHNNGMQALSAVEKNAESTVLELIFGSNRWYLKERQQT